ncbi:hypothetical protein B0H13DRAFT_1926918 [Mycena leptocephala]|nr:hypothetical protein B0H13DRAFT_1926918 [Mycena leptocephala]
MLRRTPALGTVVKKVKLSEADQDWLRRRRRGFASTTKLHGSTVPPVIPPMPSVRTVEWEHISLNAAVAMRQLKGLSFQGASLDAKDSDSEVDIDSEYEAPVGSEPLLFSRVTHIELLGPAVEVPMKAALVALPQLTHLANIFSRHALKYWKHARPFMLWFISALVGRRSFVEDWYIAMDRGTYHWDRAEAFIAKCRTGKIDPLQYEMVVEDSKHISSGL